MSTPQKETLGPGLLMAVRALSELNIFWEFHYKLLKALISAQLPLYKWEKPPEKC